VSVDELEPDPPEPPLPEGLSEPPVGGVFWLPQPVAPAAAKMPTNNQHEVR
jgi:hypothetical protein